ncbi:unnamed protein product [Linum tenue]|uniref:RRM domain-containing protein n=1 Tax=Linum tenue TaxID=586396 RepID=A0AAV0JMR7_9ROSI|nr:unnamed protein product [Linum tenue]
MAAALKTTLSLFSVHDPLALPSSSRSSNILSTSRPLHSPPSIQYSSTGSVYVHRSGPIIPLTVNLPTWRQLRRNPLCLVQEAAVETETETGTESEQTQAVNQKRKLFVLNLPWSLSVVDIKELFGQCGTVADVEIIKRANGKSKGYVFVTMASGEEAQAVVDKFHSQEVSGRIVTVEFANGLKRKLSPTETLTTKETSHKLYVSNLAWKVRGSHLRELFSPEFNPVSSRVVFQSNPGGKSAGYGFVSFASREEAEAAISAMDGKDLMGRAIRLKFSNPKTADESGSEKQETESVEELPETESLEEQPETENLEEQPADTV